ncbi:MAG: ATP-binding protein [Lachnospiraceae bacterium]|nr:ATP-binding protein [uncultured Lachnoanaerobaculum sp.]RKW42448.1 MAG: ATP-binding protein [Lachnospiraceae bacterium]
MELKIRNVGKIDSADIEIKGITIIAGLNGTGKSTVSRSLFAIFHSFSNISKKIRVEKQNAILRILWDEYFKGDNPVLEERLPSMTVFELVNVNNKDKIKKILNSMYEDTELHISENSIEKIIKVNETSDIPLRKRIASQIFSGEFRNNISDIRNSKGCRIELKIKDSKISVVFDKNNEIDELVSEVNLGQEIVYIDDPFIIDSYNTVGITINFHRRGYRLTPDHRKTLFFQYRDKELGLVEKVILEENLKVIYKKINDVLGSEMALFKTDEDRVSIGKESKGLSLDSLSSGMKTFYLIKRLIDNGTIVQNGTLILDEPEVHLHPDWQVTLAEVIVLLQREMGLHILINTHSPYFLRAIEVFSGKYDTEDVVKYYLSYNEGDNAKMKDVTFNISEIYKVLSDPLQRIENEVYNDRD